MLPGQVIKLSQLYINDILQELNNVQINKRNFNKMDELSFNNKKF